MGYAIYSRQDLPGVGKAHEDFFRGVKDCLAKKLAGINAAHSTAYNAIVDSLDNSGEAGRSEDVTDYWIEVKEDDNWSLKLQLEARNDIGVDDHFRIRLLFGVSTNGKSCNPSRFSRIFDYWTQYKPALIYLGTKWKNKAKGTVTRTQKGTRLNNFHSAEWLFAEDVEWLFNSIMDTSNQKYSCDDVANWFCVLLGMI